MLILALLAGNLVIGATTPVSFRPVDAEPLGAVQEKTMDEKAAGVLQKQRYIFEIQNNKGLGGYIGDLPKEGTYTCIIWVNKSGMMFGKKMTATFTAYKQIG